MKKRIDKPELLRAEIKQRGIKQSFIYTKLKISQPTFLSKLKTGAWYPDEIEKLKIILKLTDEELQEMFSAKELIKDDMEQ